MPIATLRAAGQDRVPTMPFTEADAPQRRAQVVLRPFLEPGRVQVLDHASGRRFGVGEIEAHILKSLDGMTTLGQIAASIPREFPGVRGSVETVVRFADRLEALGLLEGSTAQRGSRRRIPLFRRLAKVMSPPIPAEGLYRLLLPLVRLAYRPWVLVVLLIAVVWAGYESFFDRVALLDYAHLFQRGTGLLAVVAGIALIGLIHELGHGLTCRYFGAPSRGIGCFFIYGIPLFYCDVSGAYDLSSRSQRIAIDAAGLGWQLTAGAVAYLGWRALEPGSFPALICQVMLGTCGAMSLMNLNPFIRMDGYYLLSDFWSIANLREKSIGFFQWKMAAILCGSPSPRARSSREARIFFWFGLLSSLYTTLLVSLLLYFVSRWMLSHWHGTGAVVLGFMLMSIAVSWARSTVARSLAQSSSAGASPTPPTPPEAGTAPRSSAGPRPQAAVSPEGPPPWKLPRARFTLLFVILAIVWFWNAKWHFFIASPCTLEAWERVPVRPAVEGVLRSVPFSEGDVVRRGELLGVLESADLSSARTQARQKAQAVQAVGDAMELEAPVTRLEKEQAIMSARQEVRAARADLDNMLSEFPARLAEADRQLSEAGKAVDAAELVAKRLRVDERAMADGNLPPNMQAIAERIQRVDAQRRLAATDLRRTEILVGEGALQRQKLDSAQADLEQLSRDRAALESELRQEMKALRERREDAEAEVEARLAARRTAEETLERVRRETRNQKLDAQRDEVRAREDLLAASISLRAAADIKRAQAQAKRLEARPLVTEIGRLDRKIRETRVLAPASGIISTPRLREREGKKFNTGETIAWIDEVDRLRARVFVDEKEIGFVHLGQVVQVKVGAFPDRLFEGTVLEQATRASDRGGKPSYEVILRIQNSDRTLRPGITGYAKVIVGDRPLREVVFRKLIRYFRTEVWTWF